jgi:DNA-binding NarL/FixJ family response regulator
MTIRVLIADDQPLVRSGLRTILEDEDDIEVVAEAVDGLHAVELAERRRPDVVLMDIHMPRLDGIAATARLTASPTQVLVLTTFDLDEYVFGALRAGAAGFLLKDAQPETLVEAIRTVARGHGVIAPEVTRRLIAHFAETASQPADTTALAELSDRERDVMLQLARGHSNAEIARRLEIEETTVKTHVSHLLGKLSLHSRVQAVILAYETGLVRPGR